MTRGEGGVEVNLLLIFFEDQDIVFNLMCLDPFGTQPGEIWFLISVFGIPLFFFNRKQLMSDLGTQPMVHLVWGIPLEHKKKMLIFDRNRM